MDQEEGVEIDWIAFSQPNPVQKRAERRNNRRVVAALPGNHEFGDDDLEDQEGSPRIKVRVAAGEVSQSRPSDETGLPPQVLKFQQDKERARKRFRYIAFGLLTLCMVGIIIAAGGDKNNRQANNLEQAANHRGNNDNPTQDPFQDSPSMTPTILNGAATSTSTSAPTTAAVTPTNTPIATSSAPTERPVVAPTLAPTSTPVATTSAPTVSATAMPSYDMVSVIANARKDIEDVITGFPLLVGKFLRLIFHDCVGGCDGCVDLTNPDNGGLKMPIDALAPIVAEYEGQGLSRTDIWMLSAVVASDFSERTVGLDFPFQWIGRKTCDQINNGDCGLNAQGLPSSCTAEEGPHRVLCHADTAGTQTIEEFMIDAFGFDAQQTAVIMGAHTVGAMRAVNLGFEGQHGWDKTNDNLDQGYFMELAGRDTPDWTQVLRNNSNLDGIPDRFQFQSTTSNGITLTMLNSDIALVRNLVEGENLMSDGRVTCSFSGDNACDDNTTFSPFMQMYAESRSDFLADFRDALDMMIENGYRRDASCGGNQVCVLTSLQ